MLMEKLYHGLFNIRHNQLNTHRKEKHHDRTL